MFVGTLARMALDWFTNLPEDAITPFEIFSRLFITHFFSE